MEKKQVPYVESRLRHNILEMPPEIRQASGIVIYGRRIKSLVFTTDLAIIKNCDADAVFAVYPFTPQQSISDAIIKASYIPVFCGVGGGTTQGLRTVSLAKDVESQGAMGVVLNSPINNMNLLAVAKSVDIPVIITVVDEKPAGSAQFMVGTDEFCVPLGALIDVDAEIEKQEAQLKHLEGFLAGVMKKLSNEKFVAHAPEAVVALERKKQSDSEEKIAALKESLAELKKQK